MNGIRSSERGTVDTRLGLLLKDEAAPAAPPVSVAVFRMGSILNTPFGSWIIILKIKKLNIIKIMSEFLT